MVWHGNGAEAVSRPVQPTAPSYPPAPPFRTEVAGDAALQSPPVSGTGRALDQWDQTGAVMAHCLVKAVVLFSGMRRSAASSLTPGVLTLAVSPLLRRP